MISNLRFEVLSGLALWSVLFANGTVANAAEIKVIATSAIREFVVEAVAGFEKSTNNKVQLVIDTGPNAEIRASAGEAFDVIIIGPDLVDKLIRTGKVMSGSATVVAVSPLGLGALAAKSPELGTVEGFKQALLDAKAIGMGEYQKGAAGAVNAVKIVERLGLASAIMPKIKTYPPTEFPRPVTNGAVDFWLTQAPEIVAVAKDGLKLQLFPEELQIRTAFTAGMSAATDNEPVVRDLLTWLRSPTVRALVTARGMELPR